MAELRIFLSYRREDASGHAGRLYDALAARFGSDNVFMDIDTIDLGADFVNVITEAVASCDALIALIGRHWVDAVDKEGRRRLDQPDDFVRLELEAALNRDVFVIPACVQGAAQPSSEQLPQTLAPLARRHGTELRDVGWRDDVKRLIERLERLAAEKAVEETPVPAPVADAGVPRPGPRRLRSRAALAALTALVLAAGATIAILATRDDGGTTPSRSGKAAESELRPLVPAVTRPSCHGITYGEKAARVSLECSGPRLSVTYHLFPSKAVMDAWYSQRRELVRVEPSTGTCTAEHFRGDGTYAVSGRPAGRRLCYFDYMRAPQLVWTDSRTGVGAEAGVYEGTGKPAAASLLRQWRCCLRLEA